MSSTWVFSVLDVNYQWTLREFITQLFAILKVLGAFYHQFYWSRFVMFDYNYLLKSS